MRYQTFSSKNGGEYTYKKGEAPAAKEQGSGGSGKSQVAGVGGVQKGAEEKEVQGGEDGVDAEWAKLMNSMKLTSKQGNNGLENVEVTYITGENACRLCNGKGVRGCSKCSVPSASQEEAEKWTGGAGDTSPPSCLYLHILGPFPPHPSTTIPLFGASQFSLLSLIFVFSNLVTAPLLDVVCYPWKPWGDSSTCTL